MTRLFGETQAVGQRPLFDAGEPEAKLVTKCPVCGAEFKLHPLVAAKFERCSSCREAGHTAQRLFEEQ